jgi:phosphoglycolate phosphatase
MPQADSRYPLIVFDWDGTLIDSASAIVECIQQASRDMQLDVPDRETASHVIGLGLNDALRVAVPGLARAQYMEFVAHYRRHFLGREEAMTLFPGVSELILALRRRGHQLAVATGKSRQGLERALEASGLKAHFDATRCADETLPKPHPAMLLELLEELALEPSQALMIGDTSHDLEMAKSAQVDAIAVTYGAHPEARLRDLRPLAVAASVEELSSWLARHA